MKKVLVVADTYFPKIDGIMRSLQEIVPRIAQSFDITLLVPNLGGNWEYKEVLIKVSRLIKLSGYPSIALTPSNIKKIKTAVRSSDIVFIQGPALLSILSIYYARKYHKTVMYYIHSVLWELYEKHIPTWTRKIVITAFRKVMIYTYNKCNVLMMPYSSLVEQFADLNITAKKEIVHLGVDNKIFTPPQSKDEAKRRLGIDPKYTVVGYIGRISKEKNVAVLCAAVQRLQDDHKIMLLIVGNGTRQEVDNLPKVRNMLWPGFQKDVAPYYQAMDIFVMPSLTETTSLATLEAMATGVPVITTKVGFLKEYVKRNVNGLLFPKGNVFTLVLQLRKLIKNKNLRMYMGKNARQTAREFSWDKTARRIKEIMQR